MKIYDTLLEMYLVFSPINMPYSCLYTNWNNVTMLYYSFLFGQNIFRWAIIIPMLITYFIRGTCQYSLMQPYVSAAYVSLNLRHFNTCHDLSYFFSNKLLFNKSIWHLLKLVYYWHVLEKNEISSKVIGDVLKLRYNVS